MHVCARVRVRLSLCVSLCATPLSSPTGERYAPPQDLRQEPRRRSQGPVDLSRRRQRRGHPGERSPENALCRG